MRVSERKSGTLRVKRKISSWIKRLEAKKRESLAGEERKQDGKKMGLCYGDKIIRQGGGVVAAC